MCSADLVASLVSAFCRPLLFSGAQFIGSTEQDFAEAGRAFPCRGFFRFGVLFFRSDQCAVFVLMGFADSLPDGCCFFGGHGGALVIVLRGYLQSANKNSGTVRVDAVDS